MNKKSNIIKCYNCGDKINLKKDNYYQHKDKDKFCHDCLTDLLSENFNEGRFECVDCSLDLNGDVAYENDNMYYCAECAGEKYLKDNNIMVVENE